MKGATPARRSRKRLPVLYGPAQASHIGYSGNISQTGMMIRTTRVFAPGTLLHLDLEAAPRHLRLQGRVVWARAGEIAWLATGKIGMGVKFVDPPEDLFGLLFPPAAGG